jgi:hypothetical protein
VRDGRRATLVCDLCEALGLQPAFRTDAKWVCVAPQYVARDQVPDHGVEKVLSRIDQHVLAGTECLRTFLKIACGRGVDTAGIDRRRHDVTPAGFLEPGHTKRRVEAAGESKNDRALVFTHSRAPSMDQRVMTRSIFALRIFW